MHTIYFLVVFLLLVGCSGNSQQKAQPQSNISSYSEQARGTQNINTGISKEKDEKSHPFFIKRESNIKEDKKQKKQQSKEKVILNVPIIEQKPQLINGCEVTSLAMLLQYAGVKVGKMELAQQIKKDSDPLSKSKTGDITHWGNPNHGFVGDITGKNMGYAVYAKPTEQLMKHYLPDRTLNLTGKSFDSLLHQVENGKPVLVWTTGDFKVPDRWESWNHGTEKIRTPMDLHAVVLVGYDPNFIYVNDPLTGKKAQKVNKKSFIHSWNSLGKQALSYR